MVQVLVTAAGFACLCEGKTEREREREKRSRTSLRADALLQAAVTDNAVHVVVDDGEAIAIVDATELLAGHGKANSLGNTCTAIGEFVSVCVRICARKTRIRISRPEGNVQLHWNM